MLKRFTVKNYGPFRDEVAITFVHNDKPATTLDVICSTAILYGANDAGKTMLLRALSGAMTLAHGRERDGDWRYLDALPKPDREAASVFTFDLLLGPDDARLKAWRYTLTLQGGRLVGERLTVDDVAEKLVYERLSPERSRPRCEVGQAFVNLHGEGMGRRLVMALDGTGNSAIPTVLGRLYYSSPQVSDALAPVLVWFASLLPRPKPTIHNLAPWAKDILGGAGLHERSSSKGVASLVLLLRNLSAPRSDRPVTVVLDDFGEGVHPLSAAKVAVGLIGWAEEKRVQIVMATHETRLLNEDLHGLSVAHFVGRTPAGDGCVRSVQETDAKVADYFARRVEARYFAGHFGGVPDAAIRPMPPRKNTETP